MRSFTSVKYTPPTPKNTIFQCFTPAKAVVAMVPIILQPGVLSSLDSSDETTHLVLGNEACDLDSAVAALVWAFHLWNVEKLKVC